MNATYRYSLFGLSVESAIPLPDLAEVEGAGPTDVSIVWGQLAAPAPATAGFHVDGDAFVLSVPEVASYRVEGGTRITVDAMPGVPERNVRLYLLGSAFGALIHQRGLLPLHANAVEIDGRAIAFTGTSGEGKSTLAAWFHDQGFPVIADDVCVIGFDGGQPSVLPGLPRLRLWEDALEASGRQSIDHERSYAGDDQWNKFDVQLDRTVGSATRTPLAAIFRLGRGEELRVTRLTGIDAAEAVFANTYRGALVYALDRHMAHWSEVVRLVRSVHVYDLERRWSAADFEAGCRDILEAAQARLADSVSA